ncbi:MAG: metallophosphatase family protein [Thermoleophilia bacterium]|nr:metallophosphatase family protein [Thermoleophilia bacterium]
MVIAVISDTHFPRAGTELPPACAAECRAADLVVHAGDLADAQALAGFRALGPPLVAVCGNIDDEALRAVLPETAEVEVGGLRVGVVHDAGPEAGRGARLRRRFPGCGLVVFGHSHIPLHAAAPDGFQILNPGSPTDRRRQPRASMALVEVGGTGAARVRFIAVDEPPGALAGEFVRTRL